VKFENPLAQYVGKCVKFDLQRMYKERAYQRPEVLAKYYYITGYKSQTESDEKMITFEGVRFAEPPSNEDEYANSMIMYRDYKFNELHKMRPQDYIRVIEIIFHDK
jgi:hypothetical protein